MARNSRSAVPGPTGGRYWTDGWDGYPAARARLLQQVAERRLPGMVALGGDVHAHYVAGLKSDFDNAQSPVVASEFCATSISSRGASQAAIDAQRGHNPHLQYARADQRGYIALSINDKALHASLMQVKRPQDPLSPVDVAARFVVEAGRPGPLPA